MSDLERLKSVADISRVHAAERPDAVALDFNDRTTTYGELDERASRVAQGLIGLGQKPGARVGYLGKNCDRYFEVLLGAFKAQRRDRRRQLAPGPARDRLCAERCRLRSAVRRRGAITRSSRRSCADCPPLKTVIAMDGGHRAVAVLRGLARRAGRHRSDAADRARRRCDPALHLGHHRPSQGRAAHQRELHRADPRLGDENWGSPLTDRTTAVLIAMPFFHVAGVNIGLLALAHGARAVDPGRHRCRRDPAADRSQRHQPMPSSCRP